MALAARVVNDDHLVYCAAHSWLTLQQHGHASAWSGVLLYHLTPGDHQMRATDLLLMDPE